MMFQEKIQEIYKNFPIVAQEIIEQYYLVPFNGSAKYNLQDGYIERPIHGAMHAVRVSLWVELLHNLHKEYLAPQVMETLNYFNNTWQLSEENLLTLIKLAAIFHDSARQDEYEDRWDEESSKNFLNFSSKEFNLLYSKELSAEREPTNSINLNLFDIIAKAIALKDDAGKFNHKLAQDNLIEEDIKNFDYIRQLIHDADCLDIVRCIRNFDINHLEIYKKLINNQHVVISLAKEARELLYQQGDILFNNGCIIITKKEKEHKFKKNKARFLWATKKVELEHAQNVYFTMLELLAENNYFTKFFKQNFNQSRLHFPKLEYRCLFHKETVIFNPFIHGTNSSILVLLPRTDFKLQSIVDLMNTYQLAPISGEISGGGFTNPTDKCYPCFGRLGRIGTNNHNSNRYSKELILESYACKHNNFNITDTLENIKKRFSNIYSNPDLQQVDSKILAQFAKGFIPDIVDICRIIQLGYKDDLLKIISLEKIHILYKSIKQMYYFLLIAFDYFQINSYINSHIFSDIEICLSYQENKTILTCTDKAIENYFHNVLAKINESFDMQKLWEKGPYKEQESFNKLIDLLKFPEPNVNLHNHNINSSAFNLFKLKISDEASSKCLGNYNPPRLQELLSNRLGWANYNCWLYSFVDVFVNADYEPQGLHVLSIKEKTSSLHYREKIKLFIEELHKQFQLLIKLIEKPLVLTYQEQQQLIKQPFPIILCHQSEEKMHLIDLHREEYRSQSDIILGEDIKIIATDTDEHKELIERFLYQYRFKEQVQVVLFDDLKLDRTQQPDKLTKPYQSKCSKIMLFSETSNNQNNLQMGSNNFMQQQQSNQLTSYESTSEVDKKNFLIPHPYNLDI